ncbi:hypothetical protein AAVH_26390, partial [Aphelenchoides avenae]
MARLLSATLLILFSAAVHAAIYTFPAQFRLIFPTRNSTTTTAVSLKECAALAATKLPSGFVTFDTAAGAKTCEYGAAINGYILGNSTQRSAAFEGTGAASMQLDAGQTEQYVMEKDESLPN